MAKSKARSGSAKRVAVSKTAIGPGVNPLMKSVADRLGKSKNLQKGMIVIRLRGAGVGDFCLDCAPGKVQLLDRVAPGANPPLIEVIGESGALQEILQGKADPVAHFYRGRFRVQGDLKYLSNLAVEFGLIKQPL